MKKKTRLALIIGFSVLISVCLIITVLLLVPKDHTHKYGEWTTVKEAACTESGERERACSCGAVETEKIPSLGHDYGETAVSIKATCTEEGKQVKICSNCGDVIQGVIPAVSHFYEKTDTKISDGIEYNTYTCIYCGWSVKLEGEAATTELAEVVYLTDCPDDFSFCITGAESAEEIRDNLTIVHSYFLGSEEENNYRVNYNIKRLSSDQWLISPTDKYEPGFSYAAQLKGSLRFKDFESLSLNFSIEKDERFYMEPNEDIIFIKTLEKKFGGYYPYTVTYSSDDDILWLKTGKIDRLAIGDIICLGDCESVEDVIDIQGNDCYYGVIEAFYSDGDDYLVALSAPSLYDIYGNYDFYKKTVIDFSELEEEDIKAQLVSDFCESDSFTRFLSAVSLATDSYCKDSGIKLVADTTPKSVWDNLKITVSVNTEDEEGGLTATVKGDFKPSDKSLR